jgi:hypothetical protein
MAILYQDGQFFDNTGAILAGGLIYTYTAGTTTPKASYTNQGGLTPHTNPVVLDAYGRPPSTGIWLSGAYKIIVKTSAGVQIGNTIDNFNAYDPVDWTGLTATVSQINSIGSSLGTAGVVTASKGTVVDSNKDISTFRNLTATALIANTAVQTPLVKDANAVAAITIDSVASQVNSLRIIPTITGSPFTLTTTGDANRDIKIAGAGTGAVQLSGIKYPTADGTSGQAMVTNGSGTVSFSSISGLLVNRVSTQSNTVVSCSTVMPYDNTIPQNTEGNEVLSVTITPASSANILVITAHIFGSNNTSGATSTSALFQDSTANALAAVGGTAPAIAASTTMSLRHIVAAGTTSSTTFKVRAGSSSGIFTFNGRTSAAWYGGVAVSSIMIEEYAA